MAETNKYPYPENLIREIWELFEYDEKDFFPMSEDQKAGFEAALDSLENERKKYILHAMYKDGMGYAQIGKEIERTPVRVRQIIFRSRIDLRHPMRVKYYKYGLSYIKEKNENAKKVISNRICEEMSKEDRNRILSEVMDYTVEDMELSVRAYDCITRCFVHTLPDMVSLIYERPKEFIRKCSNAKIVVQEILTYLNWLGISTPKYYFDEGMMDEF